MRVVFWILADIDVVEFVFNPVSYLKPLVFEIRTLLVSLDFNL